MSQKPTFANISIKQLKKSPEKIKSDKHSPCNQILTDPDCCSNVGKK